MSLIPAAIAIIKQFEGCPLTSYPDGNGVWTVGYGHTGPEVVEGMIITQEQADALLLEDLQTADAGVTYRCPVATPEQHGAMACLAYNIGVGNFRGSSVARFHTAGRFQEAADSFALWNQVAGKVSAGLVARRAAEAALYVSVTMGV